MVSLNLVWVNILYSYAFCFFKLFLMVSQVGREWGRGRGEGDRKQRMKGKGRRKGKGEETL